jgi:forkhead box protein O3
VQNTQTAQGLNYINQKDNQTSVLIMDGFNDPWPSPPVLDGLSSDQMDSLAEMQDATFEPQLRARSNTWPLPRPENFVEPSDDTADNNHQNSNQQSLSGVYKIK